MIDVGLGALAGAFDRLREAVAKGLLVPAGGRRHAPHSRAFTKRYADGRQRRGGALWRAQQKRLGRPVPRKTQPWNPKGNPI
jgi:hypothetical protein